MSQIVQEQIIPSVHHLSHPPRVAVAMSGGVDSSTVAYLFKQAGYDVIGLFIKMWHPEGEEWESTRDNLCCDISTILSVKQVAAGMDIPLYVLDMSQEFKDAVVDNYIEEYDAGRTPNPCSRCNRHIKLGLLWQKAQEYGAQYLATGHYVASNSIEQLKLRISSVAGEASEGENAQKGFSHPSRLYRAADSRKDQTYFLWEIDREVLPHLLFPLGSITKPQVRQMAIEANIPVAHKAESQGTCFIVDTNNRKFLTAFSQKLNRPGNIIDEYGTVLGTHRGLVFYTIGQREGLGPEVAGRYMRAERERRRRMSCCGGDCDNCPRDTSTLVEAPKLYVKKVDVDTNSLIVSENESLFATELQVHSVRLLDLRFTEMAGCVIDVQIRGGHKPEPARLVSYDADSQTAQCVFLQPVRAITPGQSAVFFDADQMLGGGVIGDKSQ